jgi:hypothetical protein
MGAAECGVFTIYAEPRATTTERIADFRARAAKHGRNVGFNMSGVCEDYRAAAGIDLDKDRADDAIGHKIRAPLLALWGAKGTGGQLWDVLAAWRPKMQAALESMTAAVRARWLTFEPVRERQGELVWRS